MLVCRNPYSAMPAPRPAPRIVGRATLSKAVHTLSGGISTLTTMGGWAGCCAAGCGRQGTLRRVRVRRIRRIASAYLWTLSNNASHMMTGSRTLMIHICFTTRPAMCRASAETSVRGSNGMSWAALNRPWQVGHCGVFGATRHPHCGHSNLATCCCSASISSSHTAAFG